jgi:hypothetical protein
VTRFLLFLMGFSFFGAGLTPDAPVTYGLLVGVLCAAFCATVATKA